ncbi:MAG: SMC-Scp complex subunit ScpB [Candidatus Thermoplasmatota archaeon]|jgi:segregation and condensation protein B|nr:SMC-Scp complex subunit ScpB [Candidatus Thermoplasmatota archaeon]
MGSKEKRLVESVLFSAGKPVSINEIRETTNLSLEKIKATLDELIQDYNVTRKNETSMEIVKAGDKFAMQVKKEFTDQSIMVTKPEIDTSLLKTLTLIAFHQPLKQSNLRRMIGTKAYEHVDQLTAMNLVSSKKHGATEMLTTTKFFPEYFGIDSTKPDEIRDFLMKKVTSKIENQNSID